ncbi:MAG: hemerythrin domain-containing protein [Planctomycetaceae bacterium]|nr:hemerythrin domain-containing protein [Planctomycetaceae bacterium]
MNTREIILRRDALKAAAGILGGAVLGGCACAEKLGVGAGGESQEKEEKEVRISAAEDLMREHALLHRVLVIYAEGARRIDADKEAPLKPLGEAAAIVRTFVEDYHEKLEETHLFPRARADGRFAALVDVLQNQHNVGRRLTDTVRELCGSNAGHSESARLSQTLKQFSTMYLPHAAREGTVLFPALPRLFGRSEYRQLGERFEAREEELFGHDGFTRMVERVAAIERSLDIGDLARFTPGV